MVLLFVPTLNLR